MQGRPTHTATTAYRFDGVLAQPCCSDESALSRLRDSLSERAIGRDHASCWPIFHDLELSDAQVLTVLPSAVVSFADKVLLPGDDGCTLHHATRASHARRPIRASDFDASRYG